MYLNLRGQENIFPELSNEEVAELYKNGGCDFTQVLLRYDDMILSVAQIWVPNYTFDDKYQELCIKAIKVINTWDQTKSKFSTYLYGGLRTQINWMIRKENTDIKKANMDTSSYDLLTEVGDSATSADGELLQWHIDEDKETRRLHEILDGVDLKPNERICVQLIYEGAKKKEVAAALNMTSSSVTNILKGLRSKFSFLLQS